MGRRGSDDARPRPAVNAARRPCQCLRLFISKFLCDFARMRRAIYPGSFDPVTNGHLDVIDRARKLFDEVIVAVAHNDQKHPLFTLEERLEFLQQTVGEIDNVKIAPLDGLLVDFASRRTPRRSFAACARSPISNSNFRWR